MTTTPWKRLIGLTLVAVAVLVLMGGSWYAYQHGWLGSRHGGMSNMAGMNMPGMDTNIPGMDMSSKSEVPGHAVVTIPAELQQRIGVTIGEVKNEPLRMSVQTVGIVRPDETKLSRIHLKTEGWVGELRVNFTGQKVRTGDPLLSIYSPQFLTTQQEYLIARQAEEGQDQVSAKQSIAQAALEKLELLDVPKQELEELKKTGKAKRYLTLRSPQDGTVLEKNVLEKEYVTPQKELYVVADLSTVWVQAKVYEYELPHVELGQPAAVRVPALPGRDFTGKVVFIQPTVEERTRTVQVRIELPNPKGLLKPSMFAHITIQHTMGEGLLVPTSAILRTGERDLAFRIESVDRFVPVEVKLDPVKFGDRFHILQGLKAGDKVVTSANFLIDSESRLRLGGGMMNMPGMDKADMKDMDHSKMKH